MIKLVSFLSSFQLYCARAMVLGFVYKTVREKSLVCGRCSYECETLPEPSSCQNHFCLDACGWVRLWRWCHHVFRAENSKTIARRKRYWMGTCWTSSVICLSCLNYLTACFSHRYQLPTLILSIMKISIYYIVKHTDLFLSETFKKSTIAPMQPSRGIM